MVGGKIRLVLADDNPFFCRELQQSLQEFPQVSIEAQAADGEEAVRRVVQVRPDVLVLDMFMPRIDGVGVLRSLRDMRAIQDTRILAMCGAGQDHIEDLAFYFGADYLLIKPFTTQLFVQRVMDLAEGRIPAGARTRDAIIYSLLRQLCIPISIQGHQYLCEAIRLSAVDERMLHNITGRLYPKIAAIFQSTPSRVERSIRHAIELGMQSAKPQDIGEILGAAFLPPQERPTNGRFIAVLAERVRMLHRDSAVAASLKNHANPDGGPVL